jgi:hypothetical protein
MKLANFEPFPEMTRPHGPTICDIAMNIGTLINCTFITLASNFMKIIL